MVGHNGDPVGVLTYSHNGFGLGHLKRCANIASRFVTEVPDSSVLMLAGTPAQAIFRTPPGVDIIKVPSVIKVSHGTWQPRTLRISQERMKSIRALTIQAAADTFRPQLLIVDYIPTGVYGELLPTLKMLKSRVDAPSSRRGRGLDEAANDRCA